jgi:hypothetical protein
LIPAHARLADRALAGRWLAKVVVAGDRTREARDADRAAMERIVGDAGARKLPFEPAFAFELALATRNVTVKKGGSFRIASIECAAHPLRVFGASGLEVRRRFDRHRRWDTGIDGGRPRILAAHDEDADACAARQHGDTLC